MHKLLASLLLASAAFTAAQDVPRMAKDAHPAYEVANIKLAEPGDNNSGFSISGHRIRVRNMSVRSMLLFSYGMQKSQLLNLPDWAMTDRYYIDGYPDVEGQPNVDQFRDMVAKVLATRFGLTFHKEQRELPVYALGIAKGGPKMKRNTSPDGLPDQTGNNSDTQQEWRFTNCSMDDTVSMLKFLLDRPVVNQTGLDGRWDFTLKWTTSNAQNLPADAPPDFFTAIQEQAGLKAEPTKLPIEVMVIDKVQRPTEN